MKSLPRWIIPAAGLAAAAGIFYLERKRPLRERTDAGGRRLARNAALAALGGLSLQLIEKPVTEPLASRVEHRRLGLLQRASLPPWVEATLGLLMLDYSLYLWHILLHRAGPLWRCHVVHHTDLDLDASTALRFHFGELALSAPWRALQISLFGIRPPVLHLWQKLTLASVIFHHSNLRLPLWMERRLAWFIMTPRLHGIHHSIIEEESNANWSSGLTLWDRLHGTFRFDLPQEAVTIGVPAYRDRSELTLANLVSLPFRSQPTAWRCPDGTRPDRDPRTVGQVVRP